MQTEEKNNLFNPHAMDLDLNFQIWRAEIERLGNIEGYRIEFMYNKYLEGWTSEEFYNYFVYLPF